MLCLTREVNQKTTITAPSGEVIVVEVIEVRGNKVRLGIEAPRDYAIVRDDAGLKEPRRTKH